MGDWLHPLQGGLWTFATGLQQGPVAHNIFYCLILEEMQLGRDLDDLSVSQLLVPCNCMLIMGKNGPPPKSCCSGSIQLARV